MLQQHTGHLTANRMGARQDGCVGNAAAFRQAFFKAPEAKCCAAKSHLFQETSAVQLRLRPPSAQLWCCRASGGGMNTNGQDRAQHCCCYCCCFWWRYRWCTWEPPPTPALCVRGVFDPALLPPSPAPLTCLQAVMTPAGTREEELGLFASLCDFCILISS